MGRFAARTGIDLEAALERVRSRKRERRESVEKRSIGGKSSASNPREEPDHAF